MPQPTWLTGRLQPEPWISRVFYDTVLKRSSTYMTAVMITATITGARALPRRETCGRTFPRDPPRHGQDPAESAPPSTAARRQRWVAREKQARPATLA